MQSAPRRKYTRCMRLAAPAPTPSSPLDWLEAPSSRHGFSFLETDGSWRRHTFDELAASVEAQAARIADVTGEAGDPHRIVGIVLPTGPHFIEAFFGALRCGWTPAPLAPPTLLQRKSEYTDRLSATLAVARPAAIVTDPELAEVVAAAARHAGLDSALMVGRARDRAGLGGVQPRPSLGLLQFTSGSTARPRGVRITVDNLMANIDMIARWLDLRARPDACASWLPLFHDMGLIGMTLTPVVMGLDTRVIRPEQFVEQPRRWLECFGRFGAAITASPSFAFGYAMKRLQRSDLAGFDFSGWRVAIAGAERLDVGVLARFTQFAGVAGFRPETLLPAYGMAEATLAVTGVPLDEVANAVRLDWSALRVGDAIRVLDRARIDDVSRIGDGVGWVVDCGAPLAGVTMEVVDTEGTPMSEGHLGEVVVGGPAVADGYSQGDSSGATRLRRGVIHTGDAGFVLDGRLFVLGRIADALSLRGRNVYAEDLEVTISAIDGVSRGRSTVFSGIEARAPAIVAVVEAAERGAWADRVGRSLSKEAGDDASVYVLRADPGTILRTSSGKPRRRAMFDRFLEGTLSAEVVWRNGLAHPSDSAGSPSLGGADARDALSVPPRVSRP